MTWLNRLIDLSMVVVVSASRNRAALEIAGVPAQAVMIEGSICIGLELDVAQAGSEWLMQVSLSLAASPDALDDALQCEGGKWLFWRRYAEEQIEVRPAAFKERLEGQLALSRGLVQGFSQRESAEVSGIGRLV